MATRKPKKKPTPVAALTDAQLDALWDAWKRDQHVAVADVIANALSGHDKPAASAFLTLLRLSLHDRTSMPDDVRAYAVSALERFHARPTVTLGEAFGFENKLKRQRTRPGLRQAIVDLIGFLHERDYSLSHDTFKDSAFAVASRMIKRKWSLVISAKTLSSKQYWLSKD
jgi:hypothetical protein